LMADQVGRQLRIVPTHGQKLTASLTNLMHKHGSYTLRSKMVKARLFGHSERTSDDDPTNNA